MNTPRRILSTGLIAPLLLVPSSLFAANVTWIGASGGDWNTSGNWSGSNKPLTSDTAVFNSAITSATTSVDQTLTSISFDTSAGAGLTIGTTGGNKLILQSGGKIEELSTLAGTGKTITINAPIQLTPVSGTSAGTYSFTSSSSDSTNTLNFGGPIWGSTTSNWETLTLGGVNTGNNTVSGAISSGSANFALTKGNAGTWILTGSNSYNGVTTISTNGGILQVSGPNGKIAGTSGVTVNTGSLFIDGDTTTPSNNNSVTDRVVKTGTLILNGGAFRLAAAAAGNTYSQSFNALSTGIGSGGVSNINTNAATGANTLTFSGAAASNYVRTVGALVDIDLQTGFNVAFTNAPSANVAGTGADAILIGASLNNGDFVTAAAGNMTAAAYTTTGTTNWTAGKNMDVTGSNSSPYAAANVNSVRFAASGANTVTLSAGANNISGGILVTGNVGANASLVTGGTIAGASGKDLVIFQNNATGSLEIASSIADNSTATGLSKGGAGVAILSGSNSYTGATTVTGGAVRLQNNNALGSTSAATIVSGAELQLSGGITVSRPITINGTGVSGTSGGLHNLSGSNTCTSVSFGSSSTLWSDAGTLTITGTISANSNGTTTGGAGNITLAANNGLTGRLTINGPGTLTLSGTNAFGSGVFSGGTLNVNNPYVFPLGMGSASSAININGAFTFDNTSGAPITLANNEWWTYNANITFSTAAGTVNNSLNLGGGGIALSGNRTMTLNGAGALTFGGTMTNTQNGNTTLTVNNGAGTASTSALNLGGLAMSNSSSDRTITINGSGNVNITGPITNGTSTSTASAFTVSTSGTVTESGTNTYGGATTVSAGLLKIGGSGVISSATSSLVLSGGAVDLGTTSQTVGLVSITTAGSVIQNGILTGTSFTSGFATGTATVSASLAGASTALTKTGAGTLVLSGSNSYGGGTTVSGGTLSIPSVNSLPGWDTNSRFSITGSAALVVGSGVPDANIATMLSGTNFAAGAIFGFDTSGGDRACSTNIADTVNGALIVAKNGSNTLTLSGSNSYTGATTVTGGTLTIGGAGNLGNGSYAGVIANAGSFVYSSSAAQTLSGTISGAGSLIQSGPGTLTLAGTNTYTGATTITGGTLTIGGAGSLGTGSYAGAISNAGSFVYNSSAAQTLSGTISGAGSLTQSGPGTLILSGSNTFFGGTTINSGTLQLGKASALGATTAALTVNGALNLSGYSVTVDVLNGSGTISNGSLTVGSANGSGTFSGGFSGTGGLTQSGIGTLTLTGSNSFTGATTVTGGTLQVGNGISGSLAVSSSVTVNTGGTLAVDLAGSGTFGSYITTTGANGSAAVSVLGSGTNMFGSNIIGPGAFNQSGSGLTIFGTSGNFTYAGSTNITNGALQLNTSLANSTVSVGVDNGLVFGKNSVTLGGLSGSGNFALVTTSGSAASLIVGSGPANNGTTYSGAMSGSGSLTQTGAPLVLTGSNSYTGATTVTSGTLTIGGAGSLGVGSYAGAIPNASSFVYNSSAAQTLSGVISGTGSLVQAGPGTLTLTGTNTSTGVTTITGGTLTIGGAGALGNGSYAGAISNAGSFAYNSSAAQTLSGVISGTGSLVQAGPGTFTLSASNTFTGGVTVKAGTLVASPSSTANTVFGTGAVTLGDSSGNSNAILAMNGNYSTTYANPIVAAAGSSGNTLQIGATGTSTQIYTLAGGITLNNNLTLSAPAGSLSAITVSTGTVAGTGNLTLAAVGAAITVSSNITTSGTVNINGVAGVVTTLSGSNSYSGGTNLNSGILTLSNSNALPASGLVTFNGGTLRFGSATDYSGRFSTAANQRFIIDSNNNSVAFGTALTSSGGSLTKLGGNRLTLNVANSYDAGTTVNGGQLYAQVAGALGANVAGNTVTVNPSGVLSLGATNAVGSSQTVTLQSNASGLAVLALGLAAPLSSYSGTFIAGGNGSGVLAINSSYTQLDMSSILGGSYYLGLVGNPITYSGTLTAGAGNVFRVGGGGSGSTLTLSNVLGDNGGTALLVGKMATTNGVGGIVALSASNGYTGATTVDGGTLILNGSNGSILNTSSIAVSQGATLKIDNTTNAANRIADTTPLTLNGGTFNFSNPAAAGTNYSETIGVVTATKGYFATLASSQAASGQISLLSVNSLANTATVVSAVGSAGAMRFSGITKTGTTVNSQNETRLATAPALSNGILPWAVVGGTTGLGIGGTGDWAPATVTGTNNSVVAYDFTADANAAVNTAESAWTSNQNIKLTGTGLTTLTGNRTINSLTLDNPVAGNVGLGGHTLVITSGLVLLDPNTHDSTNGALASGTVTAGDSANPATLRFFGPAAGNYNLILAVIADNGASKVSVEWDGGGYNAMTQVNTYTGDTFINGGDWKLNAAGIAQNGPGYGSLYVNAGLFDANQSNTINGLFGDGGSVFLSRVNTTLTVGANDITSTYHGTVYGIGNLAKTGTGTLTLTGANTYSGSTSVQNGAISVDTVGSVGGASSGLGAQTTVAAATLALGSTNTTGTLIYTGYGESTDRVVNLAGTTGGGLIDQSGSGNLKFTSNFTATGAGSKTLTLKGSSAGTGEIAGTIVDNSPTNTTGVVKNGTGKWTLSGSNSYSGGTTVSNGTLQIANAAALGTGGLTVNGGTLDLHGNSVNVPAFGGAGGTVTNQASGTSTLTTTVASGTSTYAGNIANGTGGVVLTNSGAGAIILSGSLTMAGLNANGGVTQLTQSGSIGAVSVGTGATLSMAAHSGSNYNVLNVSSLTISGFSSSLASANSAASASATYTPTAAVSQMNAGVLTDTGISVAQAAAASAVPASPEAVPEPGLLGLLAAGALQLLGRRSRKHNAR